MSKEELMLADEVNISGKAAETAEIESRLKNGEALSDFEEDKSLLLKNRVLYACPSCTKIYFKRKWIVDTVTDFYTIRTEKAFCKSCLSETDYSFVGTIEIHDPEMAKQKEAIQKLARQVERQLENRPPFEKVLGVVVKSGVLYLFTNTTYLAQEVSKSLRDEFGGVMQTEWFERNQYLRVRWFKDTQNRNDFMDAGNYFRDDSFGMFRFEMY